MRICPQCKSVFPDELNFCLEDGTTLIAVRENDPEKTLAYSDQSTLEKQFSPTAKQNQQTNPEKYSAISEKTARRSNPLLGVIIILLAALLLISGVFAGAYYLREKTLATTGAPPASTPIMTPGIESPPRKTFDQKADLKIDVIGTVEGAFGAKFLKCLVTNTGENIAESPSVSVTFYKDDIKLNDNFEQSSVKYLKPRQTIPIWVNLFKKDDFNRTTAEAGFVARETDKTIEEIYPLLNYSETQMTSKKVTSLYNFKPYPETFYDVTGIVTNENYDNISPTIYVFFYDENREIVGIADDSVGELKKGEKAKFDVGKGSWQLFGTPKTYEIFSIND